MSCHVGVVKEGVDSRLKSKRRIDKAEQWLWLCRTEMHNQEHFSHDCKVQKAGLNGVCG
jgi:hypothetical protein